MNRILLFLVLLPKFAYKALGVDYAQLKAVLQAKLKTDDRKPLGFGGNNSTKKSSKFTSVLGFFISASIGFMYMIPLFMEDIFMGLWLYCSLFIFMLSFLIISDFVTVLFDHRDKNILHTRPINDRTLLMVRFVHMCIYLLRMVVPMALAGWILIGVQYGFWAVLWFALLVVLITVFSLFFVMLLYLIIMSLCKPSKFKDILSYFQIAFSIFYFACIYFMPKAIDSTGFNNLVHTDFAWAPYIPTYWLAASFSWIQHDPLTPLTLWISPLAIIVPIILVFVVVKVFAPIFSRKILLIGADVAESSTAPSPVKVKSQQTKGIPFYQKLSQILNRSKAMQVGFNMVWLFSARSRNFKMRVYPSYGFVPVYFFYLISMNHEKTFQDSWEALPQTRSYVLLLYLSSFIVMNLLTMLINSDQYKASWFYYSAPIDKPGAVMAGAFKAAWLKFFMPVFTLIAVFVLWIWGAKMIVDILLAWLNVTVFGLGLLLSMYRYLPFSTMEQMNEKKNRFLKTLFNMLLPMLFGFGHYLTSTSSWLWWLKWLFIVLSSILLYYFWDSYKNTTWDTLKKTAV